ncbi:MAG: thymidine phosphorylase family protein [Aeromicrobium sp.]|nr:thymidine phosphorylase family protein [Burkholderiales bacterium]
MKSVTSIDLLAAVGDGDENGGGGSNADGSRNGSLALRRIGIDTYKENVAYIHRDCAVYRAEGFQALSKIAVTSIGRRLLATLNVVDDPAIVTPGQLGLSEQAFTEMALQEGAPVHVAHTERPSSMDAVRRKIAGERLSELDYQNIIEDIAGYRFAKTEIAAFVVATAQNELDREEVFYLTKAMVASGQRINWHEPLVADKHCIGGIPGNRTSMLLVPILAAHGMLVPKTSSRAITSPAGTADTMEVLCDVDLPLDRLQSIVRKHRGCLAWGGKAHLSPADDVLISVERPLGIDSRGQMVASILSKKVAAGSTHLLIDIPVGPSAKVRHMGEAQSLRKVLEYVGHRLGLQMEVIITDGRQPIGRGIGPVLEARDVMSVLQNHPDAPRDLRQKSLRLAGRILEFDPNVRGGEGFAIAREILDSGRALSKMNDIIEAQGRRQQPLALGRRTFDVVSRTAGVVVAIDNLQLARIARYAGAPMEKGAGVDLFRKVGDAVVEGEALYRVYAEYPADENFARVLSDSDNGFTIGRIEDIPLAFVEP